MPARSIAIVNHKGGVGKTTTTLNLGKALSQRDKRVLILDIDPQANLSQSIGIENPELSTYDALCSQESLPIVNIGKLLDIAPANLALSGAELKLIQEKDGYFKLRDALVPVLDTYDFILIDCPPSLGILTINALIAAREVMIIVQAQYLAIRGLNTILDLIDELKAELNPELQLNGLLLTQINRTVVSKSIIESLRNEHGDKVFISIIRQNVALVEASMVGQDIFTYNSQAPAAKDYENLAAEVLSSPLA